MAGRLRSNGVKQSSFSKNSVKEEEDNQNVSENKNRDQLTEAKIPHRAGRSACCCLDDIFEFLRALCTGDENRTENEKPGSKDPVVDPGGIQSGFQNLIRIVRRSPARPTPNPGSPGQHD